MSNRLAEILGVVWIVAASFFAFVSVGECKEIVFVVNGGQSMNNSDPLHVVGESLDWCAEVLSDNDEVGVVAFKDTPRIVKPLSRKKGFPNSGFRFDYSGGSNAGAALLTAVDMLTSKFHSQKCIVVISNGEILLDDPAASQKSLKEFQSGLQQAKWWNIPVYILNLRYYGEPHNYHSFAADANEIPCAYTELMTTLRTVIHDEVHASPLTLTPEKPQGQFTFNAPFVEAKKVKLMLLSSNEGHAALTNMQADKVTSKNFLDVFEVNVPSSNEFSLSLNYPEGTGLTLDVVAEIEGSLLANVSTSLIFGDVLEITPVSGTLKLLDDKYFDGKSLRVQVDDRIITAPIHGGTIKVGLDDTGDVVTLQKIFFEDLGLRFLGDDTARIDVGERNFLAFGTAATGIVLILILSGLLWRKNHPKSAVPVKSSAALPPISPPAEVKRPLIRNKKFSYKGALVVYVMRNPSEEFPSPLTFNLFRLNSSEAINLSEVLKSLRVETEFDGLREIIFSPGANGVYVENNSACTLVKSNTPVGRGSYVELCHEESINIASSDGSVELIVTYRSLKPSDANL